MNSPKNESRNQLKTAGIAVLVIIAGFLAVFHFFGGSRFVNEFLQKIHEMGPWGYVIYFAVYQMAPFFFFPATVLSMSAGVLFGLLPGVLISSAASLGCAVTSFVLGRYFLHDWVQRHVESKEKFKALNRAVEEEGWKVVFLSRFTPILPFVILNAFFSVTRISLKDYAVATWLGMLPGSFLYVFIGTAAHTMSGLDKASQAMPVYQWVLAGLAVVATAALVFLIQKRARAIFANSAASA